MHAFDQRLNQLLDTLDGMTAGRRRRLVRSLRQDDVELGLAANHPALQAAVKASLRVAAHEILDTLCLHLEGALSRCRSPHAEALLMRMHCQAVNI